MVNIAWQSAWLLAQRADFSDLGRNLRNGAGLSPGNLLFGAVVIVGVVVALLLLTRWRKVRDERGFNSPRALFRELCQAHDIDRQDRRRLKALARSRNLDQPSRLFLEPDLFDFGAAAGEPTLIERAQLEQLRDRIFGKRLTSDAKPEGVRSRSAS
ncbi:MAG: hypothetical protein RIC55_11095 [Pirellulaceae bacterium]